MNLQRLTTVLFSLVLKQTISAQIQKCGFQGVSSNQGLPNLNNLQGINNFLTASNLPISNNLPVANNLLLANQLPVGNKLPVTNNFLGNQLSLGNNLQVPNNLLVPNQLAVGNKKPAANNLFLPNQLSLNNNFPIANKLLNANNLPGSNNLLASNTLSILSPLSTQNNLPNNWLQLKLPNNKEKSNNNHALQSDCNNLGQTANALQINNILANILSGNNKSPGNNYLTNNFPVNNSPNKNILSNNIIDNLPINNNLGNNLPKINNFQDNFQTNNLQTVNKLPVKNYLANNFPGVNNFQENNVGNDLPTLNNNAIPSNLPDDILVKINPMYNYQLNNNYANTALTLNNNNLMPENEIFNDQQNINEISNEIVANNLANVIPELTSHSEIISNSDLAIINNLLSDTENNGFLTAGQVVYLGNNIVPNNNIQILNEQSMNNNVLYSQAPTFTANVPETKPLCEDVSVNNIPNSNIVFNNMANNNHFNEYVHLTDQSLFPMNKELIYDNVQYINSLQNNAQNIQNDYGSFPKINSLQNCQQSIPNNNDQSYLSTLSITDVPYVNINRNQNWQNNVQNEQISKSVEYLQAKDVSNNFLSYRTSNNSPNVILPEINIPGYSLPTGNVDYNLKNSNIGQNLPFGNNFNVPGRNIFSLGELNNLPIMNGLPVIGVTETVTVINTAPSVYL